MQPIQTTAVNGALNKIHRLEPKHRQVTFQEKLNARVKHRVQAVQLLFGKHSNQDKLAEANQRQTRSPQPIIRRSQVAPQISRNQKLEHSAPSIPSSYLMTLTVRSPLQEPLS